MFTLLIVGVFLFAMETTLDQKGVKFKNYWIYTKNACYMYYYTINNLFLRMGVSKYL